MTSRPALSPLSRHSPCTAALGESFAEAVRVLRDGGVILYPTDTIWGLGCDATDPAAVERIFRIKARPEAKSLVLLASDLDMVARYVKAIPEIAIDLVEVNDKPMTIIYPSAVVAPADLSARPSGPGRDDKGGPSVIPSVAPSVLPSGAKESIPSAPSPQTPSPAAQVRNDTPRHDRRFLAGNAVAADGSVGIRIPLMDELREAIRRFGRPVVSTSANVSGEPSPRVFADIPESIRSAVDYIVDPSLESLSTGLASQIIKLSLSGEVEIIRM